MFCPLPAWSHSVKPAFAVAAAVCLALSTAASAQVLKPRDRSDSFKGQYVEVYDKLVSTVRSQFYDPGLHGANWDAAAKRYRQQLRAVRTDADFQKLADALLMELRSSHVGMRPPSDSPSRTVGIGASLRKIGPEWVITEVNPLSDARRQGLRAGDVVMSPPEDLRGTAGSLASVRVRACDDREKIVSVRRVGVPWPPQQPAFRWTSLSSGPGKNIGYLRIDRFDDGAADEADRAMADLGGTDALVIDLRWNSGGNASALRLGSYFTEGAIPAFVLLTRDYLNRIGHLPAAGEALAAPRVDRAYTDEAVFAGLTSNGGGAAYWTEDLTARRYGKPVILLIGENTGSAAEGFAWLMKLKTHAMLMGRRTAGELLSSEEFDLGHGWKVVLPTAGIWGPDGENFGDKAVQPDATVPTSREDLCAGRDPEIEQAFERLTTRAN